YASNSVAGTRVELGAAFAGLSRLGYNSDLYLYGRAAYAHALSNTQDAQASFASLPGSDFTVHGAVPGSNLALVTFGAELKGHNGFSLGIKLDGSLAQGSRTYYATGGFSYAW
ncbi:MAG TPA: autotransporter outer membrane beta-barrel domain-containing protein, partial [Rhizomicrobium sp.]|nr:autotransporter outer membrane beta-barrel domain-containing protein [Rhizomicrobium sp.]